jgi:hypothetical protein
MTNRRWTLDERNNANERLGRIFLRSSEFYHGTGTAGHTAGVFRYLFGHILSDVGYMNTHDYLGSDPETIKSLTIMVLRFYTGLIKYC